MTGGRQFIAGMLGAVALIALVQFIVNESRFPDQLVAPLVLEDTSGKADAIVVMGAGVIGDCLPNDNGVRRVLLGARLWRDGRAPLLVFTGGGWENPCPIADAMARLAREVGVPEKNILVELTSTSTRENATQTALLLRGIGVEHVLLVTDRLHMRRASSSFAALGFFLERASVPIYAGHDDNVSMLWAATQETIALAQYRSRGWLGSVVPARKAGDAGNSPSSTALQMSLASKSGGPLVILGASYAGAWQLPDFAGQPVINRGVSGQQSFEMLARFDADVVAARPRAVVLWGFINDIFRAADADAAVTRVRESYTAMIAAARKNGIEPIIATEVTVRSEDSWKETLASLVGAALGKESYQARINRYVRTTNQWLREVAAREGITVLDLEAVLAEADGQRRREFTADDGSHLTPAAYAALNAYAVPVLSQRLSSKARDSEI